MARSISDIEKELLALPADDRARVALDLIRSLDKDEEPPLTREEWEAAWHEELEKRAQDVREGRVELHDADEVLAELRAKYKRE